LPFYKRHGLEIGDRARRRILAHAAELQARAKTLIQYADESAFYARAVPFEYDEKAKAQLNGEGLKALALLEEQLKELNPFTHENIENACKDVAKELFGGKLGKVAMPLRAALTGTTVSPSVFMAAAILGREETTARIGQALEVAPAS
jgi:glutamyl-tRNA synthetase